MNRAKVEESEGSAVRPAIAGVITALVGFTSSFAVVLAGLHAVGATDAQAASGLLFATVMMGVACIWMSLRTKKPMMSAWSTPGAALLSATGAVEGGWPAAVGAFLLVGVLIVVTGLWPWLGKIVASIPSTIAQAMLAGVLVPLCLMPFQGLASEPWRILPILLAWIIVMWLAPRWAVPAAFAVATIVIVVGLLASDEETQPVSLLPQIEFTMPTLTIGAVVGIAIPLYIVTMASQNIPGAAILRSYGYNVPWRFALITTGAGSIVGAAGGSHGINLAAISAALGASEEADPNPARRWIAGLWCGITYLFFALISGAFIALVLIAPPAIIPAVAGIALFASLAGALKAALADDDDRLPAVLTFLVAASGLSLFGVSAAFWALVLGVSARALFRLRRP